MAKEISGFIKLQIKGGQANPAPPVGPALGQRGVNIMEFCKAFNDKTKSMAGKPVPVEITGYVKMQIKGGQANPAPPVGPALGQRGINIMEFCKAFNEKTKAFMGKPVPVSYTHLRAHET